MTVNLKRLELLEDDFEVNQDFPKVWKACKETWLEYMSPYLEYFIKEGYLFNNHQLHILKGYVRENLRR